MMNRAALRENGFTAIEFAVVVMIVAVMYLVLAPKFSASLDKARQGDARRDAMNIAAAIEALKIEDRFRPDDAGLEAEITERLGGACAGQIKLIGGDGSFEYRRVISSREYVVLYDSPTGSLTAGN